MCFLLNYFCHYPGFDHCDFLGVDVGSSSAKSPSVVLFILWVFRNSLTVCSEIVHSVRHSYLCVCAVPAHLQQSQEQESSAPTGVCPAPALQAVLLHEAIPLLQTPPWENCRNCQCRHHPSAHALADKILCGFLHLVLYVERIVIFR